MTSCQIVQASSSTECGTTTVDYFTASYTQATGVTDLTLDTTEERLQDYYCLECTSNEITPDKYNSSPFQMQVLFKCDNLVSVSDPSGPFLFTVPATPAGTKESVFTGSSFFTSSNTAKCPLIVKLYAVSTGAEVDGSVISVDAATGDVQVDTNVLSDDNYYITVDSGYGFPTVTTA
jgi:hypothetical protein